jgi:hypothetical protein
MLDTPTGTLLLTAMDIVGPLLLLAALIYGTVMYRRRSRQEQQRSDQATRKLYGTDARPGSRES